MDIARQQRAVADTFPAGDGWLANVFSGHVDRRSSGSNWPTQTAFEDYSEYEDSYRFEIQGPRDDRDLGECLGSFPTGAGWMANVFSGPLDSSSASTWPTHTAFEDYSEYEDSYRFEIQGPRDERDLDEFLGSTMCTFSPFTNMKEANLTREIEYGSYSPTSYHGMATGKVRERRRHMPSEKEDTPATTVLHDEREEKEEKEDEGGEEKEDREGGGGSTQPLPCHWRMRPAPLATRREEGSSTSPKSYVLDYTPKRGSGPRRPRQKGKWWPLPDHFGSVPCFQDLCSSSKVDKRGHRKNNEHWTPEEVDLLVEGVSILEAGHWSDLKKIWFADSVRTAVHLKDKWRNLLIAYTVRPTSKKKGNAPLDKEVIKKIQMLAVKYPYRK